MNIEISSSVLFLSSCGCIFGFCFFCLQFLSYFTRSSPIRRIAYGIAAGILLIAGTYLMAEFIRHSLGLVG